MVKEVVFSINTFQILPRHFSPNVCHPHAFVGAIYATQALVCVLAYTDYNTPCVADWPYRGRSWNVLIKSTRSLTHLLLILRYYKMLGQTIKKNSLNYLAAVIHFADFPCTIVDNNP
jgi:hypothetical protein